YFRTLIRSASDVILILGENETIQYASPSASTVFGWADLVNAPLSALIASTHHAALRDLMAGIRSGRAPAEGVDLTAVRADGEALQVECAGRDLRDDPTVGGLVLTIRDV